ncbi:uncharacterized protein LOC144359361 [Saccoglossus kowalevskii]
MDDIVGLNVGGRIFITAVSFLTRYPHSELAAMFDAGFASSTNGHKTDKYGNVVIDRSGELFRYIFYFLRTTKFIVPVELKRADFELLENEARYYRLPELEMAIRDRKEMSRNGMKPAEILRGVNERQKPTTTSCRAKIGKPVKRIGMRSQLDKGESAIPRNPGAISKKTKGNEITKTNHDRPLSEKQSGQSSKRANTASSSLSSNGVSGSKEKNNLTNGIRSPCLHVESEKPCLRRSDDSVSKQKQISQPMHDSPPASQTLQVDVPRGVQSSHKTTVTRQSECHDETQIQLDTELDSRSKVESKKLKPEEPKYPQLQWYEYAHLE